MLTEFFKSLRRKLKIAKEEAALQKEEDDLSKRG